MSFIKLSDEKGQKLNYKNWLGYNSNKPWQNLTR